MNKIQVKMNNDEINMILGGIRNLKTKEDKDIMIESLQNVLGFGSWLKSEKILKKVMNADDPKVIRVLKDLFGNK